MKVGEKNLALAEQRCFRFLWFLHFDDQVGSLEYFLVRFDELSASRFVVGIGKSRANSGPRLNNDLMCATDQLVSRRRRKRNAKLLLFNFPGDANDHGALY